MQAFIDQAGNPSPNETGQYSVLLCVCIEENNCRQIARSLHNIKQDYLTLPIIKKTYGLMHEIGLESSSTIKPLKEVINSGDPSQLELKGIHFAGRESFLQITNAAEIVNAVFGLLDMASAVFAIVMPKPKFKPYTPPGQLTEWHRFLVQRVHHHMNAVASDAIASLVCDEYGRDQDAILTLGFANFLFKTSEGQKYTNILETPLFVNSCLCPGIQIADVFAYVGRQYYCRSLDKNRRPKEQYELWIKRLWEKEIKPKSPDYKDEKGLLPNQPEYYIGIYKMPLEAYEKQPVTIE